MLGCRLRLPALLPGVFIIVLVHTPLDMAQAIWPPEYSVIMDPGDVAALGRCGNPDRDAGSVLLDRLVGYHCGLSIDPVYYGEVFSSTRGGRSTNNATQYQALFDLALQVDFEKIGSSLPGKFFMLAQNSHGRGLTEDFTGDAQVLSNIDSGGNIL